jgi:CRP-like cAMP-binding protein
MSIHLETRELLRDKALFSEFTDRDMEEFLNLLDPVEIPSGQLVVRQDEPGDCMYILVTGRAKVVHHKGGREIELAAIVPGDFFGELALVDDGPRSADVIATENCVLLRLGRTRFRPWQECIPPPRSSSSSRSGASWSVGCGRVISATSTRCWRRSLAKIEP